MTILLSILWQPSHLRFGAKVTAGIECIVGSAMYFISTGMSLHSHKLLEDVSDKSDQVDLPLPNAKTLVIRRGYKSPIFIDESDGVDSA